MVWSKKQKRNDAQRA